MSYRFAAVVIPGLAVQLEWERQWPSPGRRRLVRARQ